MRRILMSIGLPTVIVTAALFAHPAASASRSGGSRTTAAAVCPLPTFGPGSRYDPQIHALDFTSSTTVPFGTFHGTLLRTAETTALEPGVLDNKYYLKGVGTVLETTVKGGQETFRLSEIISGA